MLNRFIKFSHLIASIHKSLQKIHNEELQKYGIKAAYAQYLVAMYRSDEEMTVKELSDICDNDKAAVSRAIAEMDEAGLIIREDDKHYRTKLCLTEEGSKTAQFICDKAEAAVLKAGGELTEEERNTFYSVLEKIEDNLLLMCEKGVSV